MDGAPGVTIAHFLDSGMQPEEAVSELLHLVGGSLGSGGRRAEAGTRPATMMMSTVWPLRWGHPTR